MEEAGRQSVETVGASVVELGKSGEAGRGHRDTPAHAPLRPAGDRPRARRVRRGLPEERRYYRRVMPGNLAMLPAVRDSVPRRRWLLLRRMLQSWLVQQ